jgi:uncharacterized protein YbbC (DUF1343 family)
MRVGLDRLLAQPDDLRGRAYGLLCHQASLSSSYELAHLALARIAPPRRLFGPEHGFYGAEQDMVASEGRSDPLTQLPIVSLYGADATSLLPREEAFAGLDLLVVDLQDIGSRYYTFATTAVWAAEVALRCGCEVWVLDRPNPLGGAILEGNLVESGYTSFVGAFSLPVRHGLTLGELVLLEAYRRGWPSAALRILTVDGWRRARTAYDSEANGWRWLPPSPNMPTPLTALLYPGLCLLEATELSEGRGTTRPFRLIGAPHIRPLDLLAELERRDLPGVRFVPAYFRPQFQKHAGQICGGVELLVDDAHVLAPYRLGVHLLDALYRVAPDAFRWRQQPYEFVTDIPAVDLLAGTDQLRLTIERGEGLEAWIDGWVRQERSYAREREGILLYS